MNKFKSLSAGLLLLAILAGCQSRPAPENSNAVPAAQPLPVAVVLPPLDFAEEDLSQAEAALLARRLPYQLVSIQHGTFLAPSGREVTVNLAAPEIKPDSYRAVLFLGGSGMAAIADDDSLKFLAEDFAKAGKPVAAIGEGNQVLREAGLFQEGQAPANATTSPAAEGGVTAIEQIVASLE